MAMPTHMVETSGLMNCMVSYTARPGVDVAARAVDVDGDVLVGILRLQVQQLCNDQVGHLVVDGGAQERRSAR